MPTEAGPRGVLYNTAPPDGGLGSLFALDNLAKIKALQAQNAFSDGLPTDTSGNVDYGSMARTLMQKGDFNDGNSFAQTALAQQGLKFGQAAAAGVGQYGGPVSPVASSSPTSDDSSNADSGAMPLFQKAISGVESGGNFGALGPVTKAGDRAYGAFQVMGANIPS